MIHGGSPVRGGCVHLVLAVTVRGGLKLSVCI